MSKAVYIAIHSVTVLWLLAAALYTFKVVYANFKELYKESRVKS